MNTGDRDTARVILAFCENEARSEFAIGALTGLDVIAVRKRVNSLARRNLVELTRTKGMATLVKSTESSKWMMVAPNDVTVESMCVLEALNMRRMTVAEVAEATGVAKSRVRLWVYNLCKQEYVAGYEGESKRPNIYRLTNKGEALVIKGKGNSYQPPKRVNSVFNLGSFLGC